MMAGDMGTRNHDPYATDKSHWVKTRPHVMIVGKAAQEMAGSYPHELKADPTHPYVMFSWDQVSALDVPGRHGGPHPIASSTAAF
jgi:hypothetical protein